MTVEEKVAYTKGYMEAMRWRDPKEELPEYYKKVIVKYERDDLKIDHECVSLLADDDGAYFFGNYRFDIIIDFDRVIGWRPIE
jgi:hypothetical protein